MKETKYTLELFGKEIQATIVDTGDGINACIAGGDHSHIGAVSITQPGKEAVTREFPGHEESVITEKWAALLSNHFDCTAVVSCGIHYENITKEQIQEVLRATDDLLEAVIGQ